MKRIFFDRLCLVLALFMLLPGTLAAADGLTSKTAQAIEQSIVLYIDSTIAFTNGQASVIEGDAAPRAADGTVYIPVRFVAETFGGTVEWHDYEKKSVVTAGKTVLEITAGHKNLIVNGTSTSMNSSAAIIDEKMYVPLTEYAEALGQKSKLYRQGLILIGPGNGLLDIDKNKAELDELVSLFSSMIAVKEVKASSHDGNIPENTLDSKLDTRWSAQGDGEWIQFDLGSVQRIGYVGIAFYNGDVRNTRFDLHVSEDGLQWKQVYSGQSSGTSVDIETFDIEDASVRYIRWVGHGNTKNDWNSLTEFQVYPPNEYGTPVRKVGVTQPEAPTAAPFTKPGLYHPDGTPHPIHTPNQTTGKTLNVIDYGADPADNDHDDAPAIREAIKQAEPGDEVYFPNGTYNLLSTLENDKNTHIELKSGVNLRGESEAGTLLVASVEGQSTKLMKSFAKQNVAISQLTFTSDWEGAYSSDHRTKNPDAGGPQYLLYIADAGGQPSSRITVDHVTFEKFERMAVRIEESSDIVVRNSTFRNATDVAGGGAGYGVSIQGMPKTDRLGFANDTYFNVVEDSAFEGPYIRHGVLIQYYAHNNLVRNNVFQSTVLDAIDLHGEDEYLNEIVGNKISDVVTGAGIGVGNTGGSAPTNHDASGPNNYIHGNTIINSREGIKVHMGSPATIIENNTITGSTVADSRGILILNAPRTIVRNNVIEGNTAEGFWGILLDHDEGDANTEDKAGRGDPKDISIIGNKIRGNTNGVKIGSTATGIVLEGNEIKDNAKENLLILGKLKSNVDLSGATPVPASEDAYVYNKEPDKNMEPEDGYNIKRSGSGSTSRIGYFKFKVEDPSKLSRAVLKLSAKLTDSNDDDAQLEYEIYGLVHDSWKENEITWKNSPNHGPEAADIEGEGDTAIHIGTIVLSEKK